MARPQTRSELDAYFTGCALYLRDAETKDMPPTPWLAEHFKIGTLSAADRIAAMHTDDRAAYFDAFLKVLLDPGVMIEVEYRLTGAEGWATEHAKFVNLLDHPDVQAIVAAIPDEGLTGSRVERLAAEHEGTIDAIPWVSFSCDRNAVIRQVQGDVMAIAGFTAEDLIGHMPMEFMPAGATAEILVHVLRLMNEPGGTFHARGRFNRPDDRLVWFEATFINRFDTAHGDMLITFIDIMDRKRQEEALQASHEQFRLLAEEIDVAAVLVDADGVVTFANAQWAALPGAAGATQVREVFHPDEREQIAAELLFLAAGERRKLRATGAGGETVLAVSWRAVGEPGDAHRSFVGTIADITATVRLQERATLDSLTGLLNRQAIEEHLVDAVADDPDGTLVVFVDLNGFKGINDTFGHAIGDEVLVAVADRLRVAVRPADDVGRYGGDEFVVVCRHLAADRFDEAEARILDRLRASLADPIVFAGGRWAPSASLGTAHPEPGEDALLVLERADLAMFVAKRQYHRSTA